jgi:hypothetical protein
MEAIQAKTLVTQQIAFLKTEKDGKGDFSQYMAQGRLAFEYSTAIGERHVSWATNSD